MMFGLRAADTSLFGRVRDRPFASRYTPPVSTCASESYQALLSPVKDHPENQQGVISTYVRQLVQTHMNEDDGGDILHSGVYSSDKGRGVDAR